MRERLAPRWHCWLRGECAEAVPFFRLDVFVVPRPERGRGAMPDLWTGELTELGASTLSWRDGFGRAIFPAVLRSCFRGAACGEPGCTCRGRGAPAALSLIHI